MPFVSHSPGWQESHYPCRRRKRLKLICQPRRLNKLKAGCRHLGPQTVSPKPLLEQPMPLRRQRRRQLRLSKRKVQSQCHRRHLSDRQRRQARIRESQMRKECCFVRPLLIPWIAADPKASLNWIHRLVPTLCVRADIKGIAPNCSLESLYHR